jgi:hypothetical protein
MVCVATAMFSSCRPGVLGSKTTGSFFDTWLIPRFIAQRPHLLH